MWTRGLRPAALGLLTLLVAGSWGCGDSRSESPESRVVATSASPEFVGRRVCADCHVVETKYWEGSHHDLAMQEATERTVLGNFDDASFTYASVTSTLTRRDGRFFVRTDGPDGELTDYEIAYTFGQVPLQQYLIEFPGGRYQVLSLCWDTRPAEEGGQRWFHLYPPDGPNGEIDHTDPLHWTGPLQNWNYMCAECHSTNVRKNYRPASDTYETSWSEIDVSCEACHGPGSRHVAWADAVARKETPPEVEHFGLAVRLEDPGRDTWIVNPDTGKGIRLTPPIETAEMQTCARCHSRRTALDDNYRHGRPLGDTHRLALLDETLYHPDGQILDEVYVYGSFLQSKMYQAGVTCSDCHEPHDQSLRFPGDDVCSRCHTAAEFDSKSHHFHEPETKGAHCVDCHMPPKNYMVVDPRHDHSLRIPRPDLSLALGTPNACNDCHRDRSVEWAVETVAKWYGPERRLEPHYGEALTAARRGEPSAGPRLVELISDPEVPAIVRASALDLVPAYLTPASLRAVQASVSDADPLVRRSALEVLESVDPQTRVRLASPRLDDPVRTVRMQAARILLSLPANLAGGLNRASLGRGIAEYEAAQRFNADRAEGRLNLAWLHLQRGETAEAEREYLAALERAPWFSANYVNLSDLYRALDRDAEGEALLRRGLQATDGAAEIHHALGLLLVRQKRLSEALPELEQAAELRPEWPRYGYVYGIALNSAGETAKALAALEKAHEAFPADRETLTGLISIHRDIGDPAGALRWASKLLELAPRDPSLEQLVRQLGEMR